MESNVQRELPRYKSHKEVWALKIAGLQPSAEDRVSGPNEETDGGLIVTPEDGRYGPFKVSREYAMKHKPAIGGYYVVYRDDYCSYSPSEPFESGYTRIT